MQTINIEQNQKTLYSSDSNFYNNNQIYINSNDQVETVVGDVVKDGSSILTVASSGDYLLDCVLYGASNITCYDINAFQYYAVCLKLWAIQTLNYEQYLSFFADRTSSNFLSSQMINKIIEPFIGEPAYDYWKTFASFRKMEEEFAEEMLLAGIPNENLKGLSTLMKKLYGENPNIEGSIEDLYKNQLVFANGSLLRDSEFKAARTIYFPEVKFNFIGHMSSREKYRLARKKVSNVSLSFIVCDLQNLSIYIKNKKFDGIFLSNIPFYMEGREIVNSIESLYSSLSSGGLISYYYHNFKKEWFNLALSDPNFFPEQCLDYSHYRKGVGEALKAYRMLKSKFSVETEELSTTTSIIPEMAVSHDVKCLVKH